MTAPVAIAHTHVHSMRLRSGAEALVARVLTLEGVTGYGFSLGMDATAARDMAQWGALARSREVPFYALFGDRQRTKVPLTRPEGMENVPCVDPFTLGSLGAAHEAASSAGDAVALVAPTAHPWEIACCTALAAAIAVRMVWVLMWDTLPGPYAEVTEASGIGVDWSLEPAFAAIRW